MAFYDDNDFVGDKLSFELRSPTRQTLQADFTFGSFDNNLMNAKRFDGLATSVYIANPNSLPTGNDQYTISVWIKPLSANNGGIVSWGTCIEDFNSCNGIKIRTNANSDVEIVNFWNGNDLAAVPDSMYFSLGTWHHILAVCDQEGERKLYVDSHLLGSRLTRVGP